MAETNVKSIAKPSRESLSLILPVYNEEKILMTAVDYVYSCLKRDFEVFEIILIDDGSKDATFKLMEEISKKYAEVIVVQNLVNLNQGVSIQRGFAMAKHEYVVHNGIDLPLKVDRLKEIISEMDDAGVMVLERNAYSGATNWRRIVSKINILLRRCLFPVLSKGITDMNFVQIYRRDILSRILPLAKSPAFTTPEMIFRTKYFGYKVKTMAIDFEARTHGSGSLGKLHDIVWSTYDMFRFRYLVWLGLEKHGKTK